VELSLYKSADRSAIRTLFTQTFSDSEGQSEGRLIGGLAEDLMNEAGDDVMGLIATESEKIIACIFFTRLSFDVPVEAFLLAPVAVHSDHQGKKIGQKLINFGLEQLGAKAVQFVLTYGDPRFYSKFGFEHVPDHLAKAPYPLTQPEGWLFQALNGGDIHQLSGACRCVESFNDSRYW